MLRQLFISFALVAVPLHASRAELVVNGGLSGPTGFDAIPAPWFAPLLPGVISTPATVAPGGLPDSIGTLAADMPASPNAGTFLVITVSAFESHDVARQTIGGLVPGQSYTLTFHYANAGGEIPSITDQWLFPGKIRATIAGQSFETPLLEYEGAGAQSWHLASFPFTADATSTNLDFFTYDVQFFGAIDGVSIVPEPSGFVLCVLGVFGCHAWLRRRRLSIAR